MITRFDFGGVPLGVILKIQRPLSGSFASDGDFRVLCYDKAQEVSFLLKTTRAWVQRVFTVSEWYAGKAYRRFKGLDENGEPVFEAVEGESGW